MAQLLVYLSVHWWQSQSIAPGPRTRTRRTGSHAEHSATREWAQRPLGSLIHIVMAHEERSLAPVVGASPALRSVTVIRTSVHGTQSSATVDRSVSVPGSE